MQDKLTQAVSWLVQDVRNVRAALARIEKIRLVPPAPLKPDEEAIAARVLAKIPPPELDEAALCERILQQVPEPPEFDEAAAVSAALAALREETTGIIRQALAAAPAPAPGKPGKPGKAAPAPDVDAIVKKVLSRIPTPKPLAEALRPTPTPAAPPLIPGPRGAGISGVKLVKNELFVTLEGQKAQRVGRIEVPHQIPTSFDPARDGGGSTFRRSDVAPSIVAPEPASEIFVPTPKGLYAVVAVNSDAGPVTVKIGANWPDGTRLYVIDSTSNWEFNNCTVDFVGSGYNYYRTSDTNAIYVGTLSRTVAEFLKVNDEIGFVGG